MFLLWLYTLTLYDEFWKCHFSVKYNGLSTNDMIVLTEVLNIVCFWLHFNTSKLLNEIPCLLDTHTFCLGQI